MRRVKHTAAGVGATNFLTRAARGCQKAVAKPTLMPPGSLMLMTILIYMCGTCGTATCCCYCCCCLMWPIPMEFFLNYCSNCCCCSASPSLPFTLTAATFVWLISFHFQIASLLFYYQQFTVAASPLSLLWCQYTWLSAQPKTDAVLASYQIKQFTISSVSKVSTVSTVFHRHDMKAQWASWPEEQQEQQRTFQSLPACSTWVKAQNDLISSRIYEARDKLFPLVVHCVL